MDADKLLEVLRGDSMARLRHLVLRRAGICPFGLRARLVSDARVLEEACFMLLEEEMRRSEEVREGRPGVRPLREQFEPARRDVEDAVPYGMNTEFDMGRFEKMKEAEDAGV